MCSIPFLARIIYDDLPCVSGISRVPATRSITKIATRELRTVLVPIGTPNLKGSPENMGITYLISELCRYFYKWNLENPGIM
jgi:hypothetical protein